MKSYIFSFFIFNFSTNYKITLTSELQLKYKKLDNTQLKATHIKFKDKFMFFS